MRRSLLIARGTRQPGVRRGAAIVEFAMTAPLLFLFCLAGIEFSRANMLRHTAAIAASAGARQGIIAGATAQDCYNAAQQELTAVGIREASIEVRPLVITDDTKMVAVGVSIPVTVRNAYLVPRFFVGGAMVRSAAITREAKSGFQSAAAAEALITSTETELESGGGEPAGTEKRRGERGGGVVKRILKIVFGV
ncbi:MAG: TadE/TadG family type IV pilus assembly protein [Planctomycetota bacterium]